MGNTTSSSLKENTEDVTEFLLKIDNLAAKFVTSSNISKNAKMSDLQFCNNLVIMTSDVISDKLNAMDIEYLQQRTEKGIVVDNMTTDKVIFFPSHHEGTFDVKNKTQKRRICNGIAKFYVKIAQLYAAILKAINPVVVYKDKYGNEKTMPVKEKDKLASMGVSYSSTQINLCNRRLNALLNGHNYMDADNKDVFVHPDICQLNVDANGKIKSVMDEEGMVEFADLFKDVYNFDIGKFDKMSDKMKTAYEKSLTRFYQVYTGQNGALPPNIKRFSDIKLRQFSKEQCSKDGSLRKSYKGTKGEALFEKYALHLKEMYLTINKRQKDLVDILKQIFSIIDVPSGEKVIIQPTLTYKKLDEIIVRTREMITEMFVGCEEDFLKGVKIFQEIILHHTTELNEQKEEHLKGELEKNLAGEPVLDNVEDGDVEDEEKGEEEQQITEDPDPAPIPDDVPSQI